MTRLWLTPMLACVCLGCRGQDVVGRWKGSWPYADASDCRTQLLSNGDFELVCARDSWVGMGRYERDGSTLVFRFTALTRDGEVIRDPSPVKFGIVEGKGNEIELLYESDARFQWRRILPQEDIK